MMKKILDEKSKMMKCCMYIYLINYVLLLYEEMDS